MEESKHINLRAKLYHDQKEIMQKHLAAVAAFCVSHNIELSEGLELANEIFEILSGSLVRSGLYDQVKEDYHKEIMSYLAQQDNVGGES